MLPADHAVFQIGLLPLLEAGMAKREVTVTPLYFCLRGHITDLPGVLSVGVAAVLPSVSNGYVSRGRTVATYARVLSNPRRVAILAALLDGPSSVVELSAATGIAKTTVRAHISELQAAGLVQPDVGTTR
jgi:predicted transcriptional regulator